MDREYQIFEELPDGSPMWRAYAVGAENARAKLEEIAKTTRNECFAIQLETKEIVRRANPRKSQGAA
jgi:hypothetical protein